MSKARIDAQGRRYDAAGERIYEKAGKDTWVETIHPGVYPANHLRQPGDKFQLKEGDSIVDWMREAEDDNAPKRKPRKAPEPVAAQDDEPLVEQDGPVGPDLV